MIKRFTLGLLLMVISCLSVVAQMQDPVHFKTEWKSISANEAEIIFSATIDPGWHVYSTDLGDGGPTQATINIDKISGATLDGKLKPGSNEIKKMDPIFEMEVKFFEKTAKFTQKVKLNGGKYSVSGYLEYGACNDENCLPPTSVDFTFSGEVPAQAKAADTKEKEAPKKEEAPVEAVAKADTAVEALAAADSTVAETTLQGTTNYWTPVISELSSYGEGTNEESHSWIYIFFTGLIGGLLALFTPCVWPIIPMTVSFFLKRAKNDKKKWAD